jgi:hypothetical protein
MHYYAVDFEQKLNIAEIQCTVQHAGLGPVPAARGDGRANPR